MATEHYKRRPYFTIARYQFNLVTRHLHTLRDPYSFSQPVRVADHHEALVVDFNLFLDELQTLVG